MSRPWILGIVCLGLLISSAANGWAQEEGSSRGVSLVDRFTSLKNKFRRDKPQAQPTQAASQRSSRQRATGGRSNRTQQRRTNQRPQASQSNQASRQPAPSSSQRGIQPSDLLPDSVFSRKNTTTAKSLPKPQEPWELAPSTSLARAGSRVSKAPVQKLARRSPTTSRANELNDALADLLRSEDVETIEPFAEQPLPKVKVVKQPKSKPAAPATKGTFDLREVLRKAKQDEVIAEESTVNTPDQDDILGSIPDPQRLAVESRVDQRAEAPPTAQVAIEPAPVVVAEPQVEVSAQPKPEVIAEPVFQPAKKEPVVAEPIVVEAKPAAQPVTPQVAPQIVPQVVPQVIEQKAIASVNDPAAAKAFASPQQNYNPMRSFLPATEQPQVIEQVVAPKRHVLQTSQQPVIVSHVEGPSKILVGREATYQVTLENTSNTTSSDLTAEIRVPEWAELVDAMSTSGVVERISQGVNTGALEWKLRELPPHSSQALRLRLIPRSGRPLQLGVRWSQAPVQTQAIVEVQEPKLEIAISGPQEVRFGKPQRYRLTLRNPGTGVTEKVNVRLVPPGGTAQDATTQLIGDLQPGEVKDIDLELTAREAGELLIQAGAFAEGGLKAEMNKTVLCRKPELAVDWRGPDKKYAGTVAAYYFRVSNPGTAVTESVNMSVRLPAGAEFVSASDGYSINAATRVVSWRLGALAAEQEQFIQLRCKIAKPGSNDFEVMANSTDGLLTAKKAFQTEVEALADLKLEVTDPQGPLPLGEQVVYEIRVRNRGTTSAEGISIVGLFSEGIDPTTVEGAQFSMRDGRVSFHPIKSLPAGRDVLLRIHAKANQVGTHVFRAEVVCQKLDIKLAAEETTRFFKDEHRWEDGETPYSAERRENVAR